MILPLNISALTMHFENHSVQALLQNPYGPTPFGYLTTTTYIGQRLPSNHFG